MNKIGQKVGPQRGDRQRFPYEPRVIGGRLLMPAELQAIHRYVVETPVLEDVTEEIRCRIWYSISRTVSDDGGHRGGMMVARSALSPSSPAPAARRKSGVGA